MAGETRDSESEMDKLTREENLANLEIYIDQLNKELRDKYPELLGVLVCTTEAGDAFDRILMLVKYTLTYYMERDLKRDIPDMDPDYFSEQIHRLNQARDALTRAKDARDIHETS